MDYQGGGGYTNSNDSGSPDQSQGQKNRRSYDEQTLIPVTLQMAMNAQPDTSGGDGSLLLPDGRPVSLVKIVGAVRSYNEQSTNILYQIEDGTGLMDVKQWVDDNDCTAILDIRKETLQENIYVKVIGQIKDYDGKKMIVANMVRPLSTGNELTHHFLEVAYSGEKSKRANSIVPPIMPPVNNGVGFVGMTMSNVAMGNDLSASVLSYIKENDGKFFSKPRTESIEIHLLFFFWLTRKPAPFFLGVNLWYRSRNWGKY